MGRQGGRVPPAGAGLVTSVASAGGGGIGGMGSLGGWRCLHDVSARDFSGVGAMCWGKGGGALSVPGHSS